MNSYQLAKELAAYTSSLRQTIHQNPELGWQEKETSQLIRNELEGMGIPFISACETGIIATIVGNKSWPVLALRADMDALPIMEENNQPYASKNLGIMHACGHDAHVAMLLTAAKILNSHKEELQCCVKLIFQPAEEIIQGAKKLIQHPYLSDIDNIMALHVWNDLSLGKISVESGPRMAAADTISITIKGKSCHGSTPYQGIDAIVAASSVIMNLQSIVSRNINPLQAVVISIGTFSAGSAFNIVADTAELKGTVRYFNPALKHTLPQLIENIISHTSQVFGAQYQFDYQFSTPPTINDTFSSSRAEKAVEAILGKDSLTHMEKIMGGEDFAYYLEKIPGCICFVGSRNEAAGKCAPHHSANFDIDETSLVNGTALLVQYILETQATLQKV